MESFRETYSIFFAEKSILFHAMLTGCGYQNVMTTDYYWDGQARGNAEFVLWQYTISGRGALDYEGRHYDITAGQAMLVHIPHNHCYYLPADSDHWQFIYVWMNGRDVIRICQHLEKQIGPVADYHENAKTVSVVRESMDMAKNNQFRLPSQASLQAYKIAMGLVEDLASAVALKDNKPDFIRKVSNYCLEHLEEPLAVEDLAQVAGYSRFHFTRLFKQHMATSPAAFLRDLRLRKAIRLLQFESCSLKEIADQCGFESSSYFCRAFQKAYNMSPGEYRKSGRKE